jgi:phage terminase large subunit-like protein
MPATRAEWTQFVLDFREELRLYNPEERANILAELPPRVQRKLAADPYWLARPKQLQAIRSRVDTVMVMCGRGWGKNWLGSHWLIEAARRHQNLAIIGETAADVRDYMVEGPSGILALAPPGMRPEYQPSKRRLTFPNGARVTTYSGDKPDQLRGFSGSAMWIDELAKFRYAQAIWDQVGYTLREGDEQQLLITTTPRPTTIIKTLASSDDVELVTGSSFENEAHLGRRMLKTLEKVKDTRLGRQEIYAKILEVTGDLWTYNDIQRGRVPTDKDGDYLLERIVIGLDPSTSDKEGDEAGIVVIGRAQNDKAYVLADLSGQYTTREWGAVTVAAYQGDLSLIEDYLDDTSNPDIRRVLSLDYPWGPAGRIHAERNQGGALVEQQLRTFDARIAYDSTHTSKSKDARAEPVHTLYQMGDVLHVGTFADLEDQMTSFLQDEESPDRVDALVYAVQDLMLQDHDETSDAFDAILQAA